MVKQPPIRRRFGMVELVDHHNVEAIRCDAGKPGLREGLDAGEYMTPASRFLSVDKQLTECGIGEDFLIHSPCLQQNLLAVGHEQQCEVTTEGVAGESAVVQGCDDGLPCAGRRDDQVAMTVVNRALCVKFFKYLGLERLGVNLEARQGDGDPVTRSISRCGLECCSQAVAVLRWPVQLELPVLPIRVEGGPKLLEEVRC